VPGLGRNVSPNVMNRLKTFTTCSAQEIVAKLQLEDTRKVRHSLLSQDSGQVVLGRTDVTALYKNIHKKQIKRIPE